MFVAGNFQLFAEECFNGYGPVHLVAALLTLVQVHTKLVSLPMHMCSRDDALEPVCLCVGRKCFEQGS